MPELGFADVSLGGDSRGERRSFTTRVTSCSPSPSAQSTRIRPNRPTANSCTCKTTTWSPLSRLSSRVMSAAACTWRAASTARRIVLFMVSPRRLAPAYSRHPPGEARPGTKVTGKPGLPAGARSRRRPALQRGPSAAPAVPRTCVAPGGSPSWRRWVVRSHETASSRQLPAGLPPPLVPARRVSQHLRCSRSRHGRQGPWAWDRGTLVPPARRRPPGRPGPKDGGFLAPSRPGWIMIRSKDGRLERTAMAVKPVIVGTDGSQESLRAAEWAAREAVLRGSAPADRGHPGAAPADEP